MSSQYQPVFSGDWKSLMEESKSGTRALVLVEELQGELQMVDTMISLISEAVQDVQFFRLNTYPSHKILNELRIPILPAIIIFKNGNITYISDQPLTRNLILENLT